jgi:hypothetical protein
MFKMILNNLQNKILNKIINNIRGASLIIISRAREGIEPSLLIKIELIHSKEVLTLIQSSIASSTFSNLRSSGKMEIQIHFKALL